MKRICIEAVAADAHLLHGPHQCSAVRILCDDTKLRKKLLFLFSYFQSSHYVISSAASEENFCFQSICKREANFYCSVTYRSVNKTSYKSKFNVFLRNITTYHSLQKKGRYTGYEIVFKFF